MPDEEGFVDGCALGPDDGSEVGESEIEGFPDGCELGVSPILLGPEEGRISVEGGALGDSEGNLLGLSLGCDVGSVLSVG